jgi:hypothetical protein
MRANDKQQNRSVSDTSIANTIIRVIRKESDRGAALVAAEYLDEHLANLLRSRMIDRKKHVDRLLKYPGSRQQLRPVLT